MFVEISDILREVSMCNWMVVNAGDHNWLACREKVFGMLTHTLHLKA